MMISTACQAGTNFEDVTSIPEESSSATERLELPEEKRTDEDIEKKDPEQDSEAVDQVEEQEEVKRYRVNPNNFMIYPLDHEQDKVVMLTFDDTPTAKATYQILDTLDTYNAKAIFYVNGHYAEPNLEALKEIVARGHVIGNHTWWHIYIRKENPETVRQEIVELNDFIEEHVGERPTYFRPPFGQNSDVSLEIIKEEEMQTMNWSNGSLDWELKTSEAIAQQVISHLKPGDTILFHDKQITADALDEILQHITEQGYEFVLPTEVVLPGEG